MVVGLLLAALFGRSLQRRPFRFGAAARGFAPAAPFAPRRFAPVTFPVRAEPLEIAFAPTREVTAPIPVTFAAPTLPSGGDGALPPAGETLESPPQGEIVLPPSPPPTKNGGIV